MLFLVPVEHGNYRFGIIDLVCVFWHRHLHLGTPPSYSKVGWGLQQLTNREGWDLIFSKIGGCQKDKGEILDVFTVLSTKLINSTLTISNNWMIENLSELCLFSFTDHYPCSIIRVLEQCR